MKEDTWVCLRKTGLFLAENPTKGREKEGKVIPLSRVADHLKKRKLFKSGIKRQSPRSKAAVGIH